MSRDFEILAELDLHGKTKKDGLMSLTFFLSEMMRLHRGKDSIWVKVITGSGKHSPHGPVLRTAVQDTLDKRQMDYVIDKGKGSFTVDAASGYELRAPRPNTDTKVVVKKPGAQSITPGFPKRQESGDMSGASWQSRGLGGRRGSSSDDDFVTQTPSARMHPSEEYTADRSPSMPESRRRGRSSYGQQYTSNAPHSPQHFPPPMPSTMGAPRSGPPAYGSESHLPDPRSNPSSFAAFDGSIQANFHQQERHASYQSYRPHSFHQSPNSPDGLAHSDRPPSRRPTGQPVRDIHPPPSQGSSYRDTLYEGPSLPLQYQPSHFDGRHDSGFSPDRHPSRSSYTAAHGPLLSPDDPRPHEVVNDDNLMEQAKKLSLQEAAAARSDHDRERSAMERALADSLRYDGPPSNDPESDLLKEALAASAAEKEREDLADKEALEQAMSLSLMDSATMTASQHVEAPHGHQDELEAAMRESLVLSWSANERERQRQIEEERLLRRVMQQSMKSHDREQQDDGGEYQYRDEDEFNSFRDPGR